MSDITTERKSIISFNDLLTDNFLPKKDIHKTIEFIDYNLRSDENKVVELYKDKIASFNNLFNDKLAALRSKERQKNRDFFKLTQNWIGYISALYDDHFSANVEDVTQSGTYEVAEFYYADVSSEDQKLISLGSIFYWSVGYEERNGQRYKESFLRFQRLPPWNVDELDVVIDKASSLRSKLKWED
jgi:hypothetical protein